MLRSEGEFTTLGRELEVVEAYLDIERARFEERLRVTIDVPAGLRNVRLPPLVLQPLVENAVKHGIAHKQLGGDVTIRGRARCAASDDPRSCLLVVQDTGAGATPMPLATRAARAASACDNVERRLDVSIRRRGVVVDSNARPASARRSRSACRSTLTVADESGRATGWRV